MSCEFRVHNFHNYDLEDLETLKEEFESLWNQAYTFKTAEADLPNHESYEEWLKEWESCCDDDELYDIAEKYYKEAKEVSNG